MRSTGFHPLFPITKLQLRNRFQYIIREFLRGRTSITPIDHYLFLFKHADIERTVELIRQFDLTDVLEQHHGGAQHGGRVRVLSAPLLHHARRGTVDGLEHRVALADIGRTRGAYAALNLGRLVGDDIAVQVGQHDHLEIAAAFDTAVKEVEYSKSGKPVLPADELDGFCAENEVKIGIIAVPSENAQEVCDRLIKNGILAIWCFAPCTLNVPENIEVRYENMALSLAYLSKKI